MRKGKQQQKLSTRTRYLGLWAHSASTSRLSAGTLPCHSALAVKARPLRQQMCNGETVCQKALGLTSIVVKTQHEVGDEREQERLRQVVRHLNQALRGRKGQLAVHSCRPLPVHHLRSPHSASAPALASCSAHPRTSALCCSSIPGSEVICPRWCIRMLHHARRQLMHSTWRYLKASALQLCDSREDTELVAPGQERCRACITAARTHRALGCCDRLHSARVDDAQEEHGQVEGAQNVPHVLDGVPARHSHIFTGFKDSGSYSRHFLCGNRFQHQQCCDANATVCTMSRSSALHSVT